MIAMASPDAIALLFRLETMLRQAPLGCTGASMLFRLIHEQRPVLIPFHLTIDLPAAWRSLTPNEAVDLRETAPYPLHSVRPGTYEVYGPVDRWLAEGFAAAPEALVVGRTDYERPVDDENLAELQQIAGMVDPGGNQRSMTSGVIGRVGFHDHPAFLFEVGYASADHGRFRLFETIASTAGDEYLLQLLTGEGLAGAPERAAALRASLHFIAPPEEPEQLSDRLLNAALIGGGIGLLLIGLRAVLRKPDAPGG